MRVIRTFVLVFLVATAPASVSWGQSTSDPAGHWEGVIHMGLQKVPVAVDLDRLPVGTWIGSVKIPGSPAVEVPAHSIVIEDGSVRFQAGLPDSPWFTAKHSSDSDHLTGEASNDHGAVPFELERTGAAHVKIPAPSSRLTPAFEGDWEAVSQTGGASHRVVLRLWPAVDGAALATLTTGGQDGREHQVIPVTTVTLSDSRIDLDVAAAPGTFRGVLGASGEIVGEWVEAGSTILLTFKRQPR